MQAWQGEIRKPSLPTPGAEMLCLSSGLAELLLSRLGTKNASTF